MILDASLDTSFWNIAAQIGVAPYLFAVFRVHYCRAVEREIVTTDPGETSLIYPQAMLFRVLQEDGRFLQAEPQRPLNLFGVGEAHAIALAYERFWLLLINDARPLQMALTLGIRCVAVPDFCVLLYSQGRITWPAVQGYLRRLASTTQPALIQRAQRVAKLIADERGKSK
jgi:predicted nucleic acid-binding protein